METLCLLIILSRAWESEKGMVKVHLSSQVTRWPSAWSHNFCGSRLHPPRKRVLWLQLEMAQALYWQSSLGDSAYQQNVVGPRHDNVQAMHNKIFTTEMYRASEPGSEIFFSFQFLLELGGVSFVMIPFNIEWLVLWTVRAVNEISREFSQSPYLLRHFSKRVFNKHCEANCKLHCVSSMLITDVRTRTYISHRSQFQVESPCINACRGLLWKLCEIALPPLWTVDPCRNWNVEVRCQLNSSAARLLTLGDEQGWGARGRAVLGWVIWMGLRQGWGRKVELYPH